MPALRFACYNGCAKRGDRKNNTRLLLSWIADDDLRGITKYSIVFRSMQLLMLIPTCIVLVKTYVNAKRLFSTTTLSSTALFSLPCGVRRISIIVWFFWSFSLLTVVSSIALDIVM